MPDSTRPIRALMRGLEALTVMNRQDGVTVTEVAAQIRLPRTTSYRILETLCEAGYAFRDHADERYRLTAKVSQLAEGLDPNGWMAGLGSPLLAELASRTQTVALLASRRGDAMTVHAAASATGQSPTVNSNELLLGSAMGLAWLSACAESTRMKWLEERRGSQRAALRQAIDQAALAGFALDIGQGVVGTVATLALPVCLGDRVVASLALRLEATALSATDITARHLGALRETASLLRDQLAARQGSR